MRSAAIALVLCLICCALTVSSLAVSDIADTSPAFVYTDETSKVSFSVPKNWSSPEQIQNDMGTYTVFSSTSDSDLVIWFHANDVYAKTSPDSILEALQRFSRSTYDNDQLSKEAIAEPLNCTSEDLTELTCGNRVYYHVETGIPDAFGNRIPSNLLLRMENGFLYLFSFTGPSSHPQYQEFLSLVSSAEYPSYSVDEHTAMLWEALIIIVALILHGLPVVIYRYCILKKPAPNAKTICFVYAILALLLGGIVMGFLNHNEVGAAAIGIAIAALLNYRMLAK